MKLVLITAPETVGEEHKKLVAMLEKGQETVHLRKPDFSAAEMREWLQKLPSRFHQRIMLHQHHELGREFEVMGLHFPEALRQSAKQMPKDNLQFSASFHLLSELQHPDPVFDYVFLSPVFDSISKAGYAAAFPESDLQKALNGTSVPVLALGGVDKSRLQKIKDFGFTGAAVLGAVWQAPDPVQALAELVEASRKL